MPDRRRFIKNAAIGSAALCAGTANQSALAETTGKLTITNDYDGEVTIELFHPDAFDRVFATYTFASEERSELSYEDRTLYVKSDWGIRVRFPNGVQSAVMRLAEVGGKDIKASNIYNLPFADYVKSGVSIKNTEGYKIGADFGNEETRLLSDAMSIFYERFLRSHTAGCPELCTKAIVANKIDRSEFSDDIDDFDLIEEQRFRLLANETNGFKFPHVELLYANEVDGGWLAKALVGTVKVLQRVPDRIGERYPIAGTFEIIINDDYLNDTRKFEHYGNAAYWAGVIAHEALHNLGHSHPPSLDDPSYYKHQMIIVDHLVIKGEKIKFGEKNPTPVLCRKRE